MFPSSVAPIQKPAQSYYEMQLHTSNEIRFTFSSNPQPTVLKWYYGINFRETSNIIQIPSEKGKLSTSITVRKKYAYINPSIATCFLTFLFLD